MAKYLKPQTPLQHQNGNYIYPLTTVDQVIIDKDNRLNSLFKKTIKEIATLQAVGWSNTKPYTQTITLNHSVDDYDVDANVAYGDEDNAALHAAAGCLSYIKKNNNTITFYCLKKKPDIDLPVELTGTCRNTIATVEEGIKLNFDIVAYNNEEELLADTPAENTIGVVTTTPITDYIFSATQPSITIEGCIWISTGTSSTVEFNALKKNGIQVYPMSAKQMVSGVLKDVIAKTYQNGSWIEWIAPGTIFKKGYGWVWEYGYTLPDGSCEVTAEGIYMPSSTGPKNGLKTETTVDVGSYRTLHVKLTGGGGGPNASTNGFYFGFGNDHFDWPSNNWNAYVFKNQNYEDETELTLDISGVSNLYFKMFVYTSNAVTVTDMWMT